ncbi:MAG: NB-ARC domain-containing protein [Chloroflexota bacterium]
MKIVANATELQPILQTTLTQWHHPLPAAESANVRLLLLQRERANGQTHSLTDKAARLRRLITDALEKLATGYATEMAVIRARFLEGKIGREVALSLHASRDQVNRWQRKGMEKLAETIWQEELKLRQKVAYNQESSLHPPSYITLVGVRESVKQISAQLLRDKPPWVVAITGIGGIGKTSLADQIVRHLIHQFAFDEVVWLRVGQQRMSGQALPADLSFDLLLSTLASRLGVGHQHSGSVAQRKQQLWEVLKQRRYLIIVDNLESQTVASYLLAQMNDLAGPSKFLLTSRSQPVTEIPVFTHSLSELPFADAVALLQSHSQTIGLTDLAAATEPLQQQIYGVTGGNPLALKLVVSMAAVLPIPQILADLSTSRPGPIESLFRDIYWESWRTLSAEAQLLLQTMPLVTEQGALPEQIQAMSGLDDDLFWTAVRELSLRSLLEVRGSVQQRRYGIHRLTETFLNTEIIGWPTES